MLSSEPEELGFDERAFVPAETELHVPEEEWQDGVAQLVVRPADAADVVFGGLEGGAGVPVEVGEDVFEEFVGEAQDAGL